MAIKFARILAFMGLASDTEPVTEAHLQTANDKIAQLEADKATADASLATVTTERDKAKADLTAKADELATLEKEAITLREWKQNNKAQDGRTEDATNNLGEKNDEPKAAWEVAAAKHVADTRKRLGEK